MADNGFCPEWIWDNFDRYVDPFWDHVYLTVVAVAVGFAISFTLALIAYRRRWLDRPDRERDGDPLHGPEPGGVLPAPADHRPRQDDRADRARRLHAADHLPQRARRARQRPRGGEGRRARDGADRAGSSSGASSCRSRCRRSSPACAWRPRPRPSAWRRSRSSPAPAGWAARSSRHQLQVERRHGRRPVRAARGRARRRPAPRPASGHPVEPRMNDFGDAIDFIFNSRETNEGVEVGGSQFLELADRPHVAQPRRRRRSRARPRSRSGSGSATSAAAASSRSTPRTSAAPCRASR